MKHIKLKYLGIGFAIFFLILILTTYFVYRGMSVDNYPKLSSCIKASVSKKTLCKSASDYIGLNAISKNVIESIIISEDDKFYFHDGFDWKEFRASVIANLRAFSFVRGGSTITQQLVKNVYLSHEKSITRKIKEAVLASQIEKKYKKSTILEKYLNAIEFGIDIWGINKASYYYFSKPASELTNLEGAYLAVLLPSPKRYSNSFRKKELTPYLKRRIKKILYWRMRKGQIEKEVYNKDVENIDFFPWTELPSSEPGLYDFEDENLDSEEEDYNKIPDLIDENEKNSLQDKAEETKKDFIESEETSNVTVDETSSSEEVLQSEGESTEATPDVLKE